MPALGLLFALFLLVAWLLYLAYRETERDFPPAHHGLSTEPAVDSSAWAAFQRAFAMTTPRAGNTPAHSLPRFQRQKGNPCSRGKGCA
jgi:hypothetical protein